MTKTKTRYSHSGICVSDMERSKAFYKNVFGFVDGTSLEIHNDKHKMLGIEGDLSLYSHFLRLGGLIIELLYWPKPGHVGGTHVHHLNELGLTHLSFNVDRMDDILAEVEQYGGKVLHETRAAFDLPHMSGEIIFITDPDGTRIELVDFPEDVVNA